MLVYLCVVAGLLGFLVLALVWAADLYEREPIENLQNWFLTGFVVQLALLLSVRAFVDLDLWSGWWLLVTIGVAGGALPFLLCREQELDERFDGIVYTVAFVSGAMVVIHMHNLPRIAAASSFGTVLDPGAAPGLRDLLLLAGSPGFVAELRQALALLFVAALVGAVLGVMHFGQRIPVLTACACAAGGSVLLGVILLVGGWLALAVLAALACGVAFLVKRRSVFRERPEPKESDILAQGVKTVLMVLGAALVAGALLGSLAPPPDLPSLPTLKNAPADVTLGFGESS